MKSLIKAFTLCLAAFPLLGGVGVGADQCCREDSCRWDGCWYAGAELLYWRPCGCGWTYGAESGNPSSGFFTNFLTLKTTPDFGFRLFAGYDSCDGCRFTDVSWTHLRTKDGATVKQKPGREVVVGPFGPSGNQAVKESVAQIKYEYDRAVLRFGHNLRLCGCVNFHTFAGVEFIEVSRKTRIDVLAEEDGNAEKDTYGSKSEFYAGGLELGIGGEYALGCGVNLEGRLTGIAAVGRRKLRYDFLAAWQTGPSAEIDSLVVHYPSHIHCVPGFDVRLGLNYLFECECSEVLVELGYQLTHFFHIIQEDDPSFGRSLSNEQPSPVRAPCVDVGFGGPYLSFLVRF